MCGLCGVYGLIGTEERKAFSYLQIFSQLRGRDSTGLAVVPHNHHHSIRLFKGLGGVETLVIENKDSFDQRNWQVNLTVSGVCFIGHHRYCTSGDVSVANAHPFDLDNIVGCHNGTLSELSITHLPSYDKDLIDSQVILKEIDSGRALEEIIKDVKGAWALVWWDKATQTLNMCRNEARTLYIAMVSDGRSLFWASESWMLDVALRRAGFDNKKLKILETTPHKHLIWGKDKGNSIELKTSLSAKARDDSEWDEWVRGQNTELTKIIDINKNRKNRTKHTKSTREGSREEFIEVYARTFDGMYIKREEYEYLTKNGCSWCAVKDNISWDQRESVSWYAEDHPVCEVCNDGNAVDAARRVN